MAGSKRLHLAKGLSLSLDFATKTAAILAQRRKGKTYTASVIAEEMVAAKQPFVALDPTGAWWGLRAGADGKREGLPVVVLGGQHGDVPLERTGGRLIADLVVEEPGYYVIDFSLFESGEAERQFAVDFAERLYRAKGQAGKDFPLHLFVDEADRFIPQQMRKGSGETSPRLLGAFEAIVRRGGLRGLGTTLISQRAAVVNKNVLEMLDVLIVLRTVGPNDQAAILGYIKAHGSDAERVEMMGSLASLEIGEAWVWEPGAEPPLFQRVRIRARRTFNSSATPKPGVKRVEPKRLADVDLAALQTRMAETVEKAKAEDPRELRKTIAELKKQVAAKVVPAKAVVGPTDKRSEERAGKIAELKTALTRHRQALEAAMKILVKVKAIDFAVGTDEERKALVEQAVAAAVKQITGPIEKRVTSLAERVEGFKLAAKHAEKEITALLAGTIDLTVQVQKREAFEVQKDRPNRPPKTAREPRARRVAGDGSLPAMHRAMLIALAQHPDGLSKKQILVHTGYASSGNTSAAFADLVREGHVTGTGQELRITDAGLALLGDFEPLPIGDELRAWLLAGDKLSTMEKAILDQVCRVFPEAIGKADVLEAAGYKSSGNTSAAFGKLVAYNYLIPAGTARLKAAEELFS